MKDYHFDVEVCTSRPVSSDDVINILEALYEFCPASSHEEGEYGVVIAMSVRTDRDQDHAWRVAKGEVARAFREELGDDEALVDLELVEVEDADD